ncbi:uncharacterized protein LOC128392277 [Panonychus citri]|uniref:uncharacterized protein LOC128392277 n=1 Tax=Panonychus citri TaxID=50023 RepID=UPI002306FE00|nr:uncharacterized protein LOC128392277 [Panonychus citri]
MFPLLLSVFLMISSGNSATISSLMDLPLTLPKGNHIIHATLKDQNTGDKFSMKEFISSTSTINGMIVVDTPKDTFNVYYNSKDPNGKDNYERQVIMGIDCSLYKYKFSSYFKKLPGVSKQLTSVLISMGPSILYRFAHGSFIWEKSADKIVRGTTMKSFKTQIHPKLNITYYYKSNLDQQSGLQAPSRIFFSGKDLSYSGYLPSEHLILEIYLQKMDSKSDLSKIVNPLPGLGCPAHYQDNLPIPNLNFHLVHMILSETITGPTTTKTVSEIYANDKLKLIRLKTSLLGIETEALYDYSLGIVNMFQDGGSCNIQAAEKTSPGINQWTNKFSLKTLFQLDGQYNYLGKMYLKYRSGLVVKAWESVSYYDIVNSNKYDKVVTTQYFTETTDNSAFNGYLIVATIINCYNLDAKKEKYQLVEVIQRDYLDFQVAESESEFHDKFSLNGCKYFTSDMTLNFQLGCKELDCIKFAQENVYALKERFREAICRRFDISPLRLSTMDVTFSTSTIDIRIDFLEIPNLQGLFSPKVYFVNDETLKGLSRTKSASETDCLSRLSTSLQNFDIVLFCQEGNICGTMKGIDNVKEDNVKGEPCRLYQIPLHNLYRLSREISNKDLQSRLLIRTAFKNISLTNEFMRPINYSIIDILDETRDRTDHSQDLFYLSHGASKLQVDDSNVVVVPNAKTYGDCYRACKNSDELECRTLSYCSGEKESECAVTNMTSENAPIDVTKSDTNCEVYAKNNLLDYSVIVNRRFKSPSSISLELYVSQCASECASDPNCFSFQNCGRNCILGGFYTDSSTEYDSYCEIYIPKVSNKYQSTGRKIVSETFHVELNLNHDQCAALCYSWADGPDSCQSFNFCPDGRSTSTCSLSKYSVEDSNTKTTESKSCFNYKLIENSNKNKQSNPIVQKGTSGSAAFGIILIFLATGFIFGVGLPIAYSKMRTLSSRSAQGLRSDQRFIWTRQMDDEPEN